MIYVGVSQEEIMHIGGFYRPPVHGKHLIFPLSQAAVDENVQTFGAEEVARSRDTVASAKTCDRSFHFTSPHPITEIRQISAQENWSTRLTPSFY